MVASIFPSFINILERNFREAKGIETGQAKALFALFQLFSGKGNHAAQRKMKSFLPPGYQLNFPVMSV